MDIGVWVGAVSGLVGALVGAGGSLATTMVNQRYQRAEVRRAQRDRLTKEAIDVISRELVALSELAWRYPEEGAPESDMKPYRLEANGHHSRIDVELIRLPDQALEERLGHILWASRLAFQSEEGTYSDRRLGALKVPYEGLSCLGAYLREDPLPPPSEFTQASIEQRRVSQARREEQPELASEAQ